MHSPNYLFAFLSEIYHQGQFVETLKSETCESDTATNSFHGKTFSTAFSW